MSRIQLTILVFMLFGHIANAQNKGFFDQAVDYCNCKITHAYLNQYTSSSSANKTEKDAFQKIKANFENCEIGEAMAYGDLSKLLNENNFSASNQKLSANINRLKNTYTEQLNSQDAVNEIISGIYNNQTISGFVSKYSEIKELKETLQTTIDKFLSNGFSDESKQAARQSSDDHQKTNNDIKNQLSEIQRQLEKTPGPFSINWSSVILTVIVGGIIFLVMNARISDLSERTDRHRKELDEISAKGVSPKALQQGNISLPDYKRLTDKHISEINDEIGKIQLELIQIQLKTNTNEQASFSQPQTQQGKPQRSSVFYASTPNRDGSFNANDTSTSIIPTASFYKFTMTDDQSKRAYFEFLNEERAIKDATSSPELILYTVCKVRNALNQNAKRIRTISPGTVTRSNDKWNLETQAEIEYE